MKTTSAGQPGNPAGRSYRVRGSRAHSPIADAVLGVVGGAAWFEQVAYEGIGHWEAILPSATLTAALCVSLRAPQIVLWLKVKMRRMIHAA
ncbi:hypothetical protein ACH4GM_13535 [Streptomyces coeruleorubidus]|uniref:hypothetical protein n=1 Tax=Streptomyces coeruleorubidus TaxID=116188 RepID=UPI0037B3425D